MPAPSLLTIGESPSLICGAPPCAEIHRKSPVPTPPLQNRQDSVVRHGYSCLYWNCNDVTENVATKKPIPPDVDWERIENDFRAGVMSLREIAAANPSKNESPINHVAITRRAKREGWAKDLAPKIAAEAERLVTRQAVTDARPVTDKIIVEANASAVAEVRKTHRDDIRRYRQLATKLLGELETEAGAETPGPIGPRITNLKAAAETLKTLVALEREAWSIAEQPAGPQQPAGVVNKNETIINVQGMTDEQLRVIAGIPLIRG